MRQIEPPLNARHTFVQTIDTGTLNAELRQNVTESDLDRAHSRLNVSHVEAQFVHALADMPQVLQDNIVNIIAHSGVPSISSS
jgi:hypothetical protein